MLQCHYVADYQLISFPQDSDTLTRLQQAILQLQGELEQLNKTTQQLLEDSSDKQKQIEVSSLFKSQLTPPHWP